MGTISGVTVVGVTVKVSWEQIDNNLSLIIGKGFTVTVIVKISVQLFGAIPAVAVTV